MSIAGLLLLVAAPVLAPFDGDRAAFAVAQRRLSRCGLGRIETRFDDMIRGDLFVAPDAVDPTDAQLSCALDAAAGYMMDLPAGAGARLQALADARVAARTRRRAGAWLAARGLLGRVPRYEPGVTALTTFGRAAERLCGPAAEGALGWTSIGALTFAPYWQRWHMRRPGGRYVVTCLRRVTEYAGVPMAFFIHQPSDP